MKRILNLLLALILICSIVLPAFATSVKTEATNVRVFNDIIISGNTLSSDSMQNMNLNNIKKSFSGKKFSLAGTLDNGDSFKILGNIDDGQIRNIEDVKYNFEVLNVKLEDDKAFLVLHKKDKNYMAYVNVSNLNNYYSEKVEYDRYWYGKLLSPQISKENTTPLVSSLTTTDTITKEKTYTYSIYGDTIKERLVVNFIYIYSISKNGNETDFNMKIKIKDKYTETYYYNGGYDKDDGCSLYIPGSKLHLATDEGEFIVKTNTVKECTLKGSGLSFQYSWCYCIPNTVFTITSSYDGDKETNDSTYVYDGYDGNEKATQVSVELNPYKYHLVNEGHSFAVVAGVASATGYASSGSKRIRTEWDFTVQSTSESGGNYSSSEDYYYSLYYDVNL